MWDFECPPFRPDPGKAVRPAPVWQGDNPGELIANPGLAQFLPVRKSVLDGAHVWITLCEPGYEAAGLWQQYRDRYDQTGLWPLFITPETWNSCPTDTDLDFRITTLADVNADSIQDGQDWLDAEYAVEQPHSVEDGDPSFRTDEDWSDPVFAAARQNFHSFDWTDIWETIGKTFYQMLLVPTPYPWLVPGLLGWDGACNAGIGWREHASVLRRWQQLWGSELIALESDMMWLRHLQPVDDRDTALSIALEAYLYCPDAVNQCHLSLDRLAKAMLEPMWQLWWD
ncbi:DUF4253 domain-containing protein [Nocardia sp. NPDC050710]|uniref:DUF4253 domain-containing protein n=1 Tax=Nocardia sp. NPDC050710 TaxID=3157220 RepID=UPI0034076F8A